MYHPTFPRLLHFVLFGSILDSLSLVTDFGYTVPIIRKYLMGGYIHSALFAPLIFYFYLDRQVIPTPDARSITIDYIAVSCVLKERFGAVASYNG
jgi:hypothetical protein